MIRIMAIVALSAMLCLGCAAESETPPEPDVPVPPEHGEAPPPSPDVSETQPPPAPVDPKEDVEEEPAPPQPPQDYGPASGLEPNELGQIPILMYHHFGHEEDAWTRTFENFAADLSYLYNNGYRPITLDSYVSGRIDLPEGMTPVVLTFDDGLSSQLRWVDGTVGSPDPESAVGVMLDFAESNPGFESRGIFYINSPRPFSPMPPEDMPATLSWLTERGFELGNHTHHHANLGELGTVEDIERAIGMTHRMVLDAARGCEMASLSLPYGIWPPQREAVHDGEFEGTSYRYDSIMLVGAEPAPSPYSTDFSPLETPRIRASGDQWDLWFGEFENNPSRRYVSDGDPDTVTIPASLAHKLDEENITIKWQVLHRDD
ncbi:MAG: xylanase [Bacillota bacterium]